MWFLGYCSPFLYEPSGQIKSYRFILYSQLLALFLFYIISLIGYRIWGTQILYPKRYKEEQQQNRRKDIAFKGLCTQQLGMAQKKFKRWYTHSFGIHSIAVAGCIMYSPYLPQMILTLIYFIVFVSANVLNNCQKSNGDNKKITWYIYNILMVIAAGINIILFFSLAMGVGASGYDQGSKICYLSQKQL